MKKAFMEITYVPITLRVTTSLKVEFLVVTILQVKFSPFRDVSVSFRVTVTDCQPPSLIARVSPSLSNTHSISTMSLM